MLDEQDSSQVLNRIRQRMEDSGFEGFDEHAFGLMRSELGKEGRRIDARQALERYVAITQALLRSVGTARIEAAKRKLSDLLCEGQEIEIVLDTEPLESIFRDDSEIRAEVELSGFAEADELADGLEEVMEKVRGFEYPDPGSEPDPDEGTPSP